MVHVNCAFLKLLQTIAYNGWIIIFDHFPLDGHLVVPSFCHCKQCCPKNSCTKIKPLKSRKFFQFVSTHYSHSPGQRIDLADKDSSLEVRKREGHELLRVTFALMTMIREGKCHQSNFPAKSGEVPLVNAIRTCTHFCATLQPSFSYPRACPPRMERPVL